MEEESTMSFTIPPVVSPDSSVSQHSPKALEERDVLRGLLKLQTLRHRRTQLRTHFSRWAQSKGLAYRAPSQCSELPTDHREKHCPSAAVAIRSRTASVDRQGEMVDAELPTEASTPDVRHCAQTNISDEHAHFLIGGQQALRRTLRTRLIRERLRLSECFQAWRWRSKEDFQQSGYSPSVSYTSIGEECVAHSPQGRFMLQTLEFMSESNRHAAMLKLTNIAQRLETKDLRNKQRAWHLWQVYSLRMEVRYYRALVRSVDDTLQSTRKIEQALRIEEVTQRTYVSSQIAHVTQLTEWLLQ